MCGIAGIINTDQSPVRIEQLMAMTNSMKARGPDDDGFHISGPVGLGFRRLSIIDVEGGHQPLTNEDKSIHLIFNGEIYNHVELRKQLIAKGHVFATRSDAEVVLHLYEDHGPGALQLLNGMFAFALFDANKKGVFLARDRLGIKPLFYTHSDKSFSFASDMRALRVNVPMQIDTAAVIKYLGLAYIPGTDSIWTGVKKLAPAHFIWLEQDGRASIQKYWSIQPNRRVTISLIEAKEHLNSLLADSIRLQMRSDVPIGIFLSGGVDSSAVVSYAAQLADDPLRTFTINFAGKSSSDAIFSKRVAKLYSTSHTELQLDANAIESEFSNLLFEVDEPIADSAIFPAYLLSRHAQQLGIKVLLNGAGGDEIFGGYARHFRPRFLSPGWVAERSIACLQKSISAVWQLFDMHRGLRSSDLRLSWATGISGSNLGFLRKILRNSGQFKAMVNDISEPFHHLKSRQATSDYNYTRMLLDMETYLPGDVLSLTDKATMAASVECRVPLLDHNLVEFAFSLPVELNLLEGEPKGLFKEVLRGRLPDDLLSRRKEGFNAPVHQWLLESNLFSPSKQFGRELHPLISELFDVRALRQLSKQQATNVHVSETLFSIQFLNQWCLAHKV